VHELEVSAGAVEFRRSIAVDGVPSAIAYDRATDTLVSWSPARRRLEVVPLAGRVSSRLLAASGGGLPSAELELGRALFEGGGDRRLARDGRACANCHPEGRDDGQVWTTPDGPRQTMMLAGRLADSAPYGWARAAPTLKEYIKGTITRLGGTGLNDAELAALAAYATSLPPPQVARADSPAVRRGREVFFSFRAGCARCHTGAAFTDGKRHAIDDGAFDTPSLRFVAGTAPYFHDGRYATLEALLADGKMGNTKYLGKADLRALEAYLGSL
jgi:cytochrome c peroxidase